MATKRKYDYFHVATPTKLENFGDYHDALKFYGNSEAPSTLYGVKEDESDCDDYIMIKAKWIKDKQMYEFKVLTTYKSGYTRKDNIIAKSVADMWYKYNQHHNIKLIESSDLIEQIKII